jgi:hypothetical protein
MPLQLSPKPYFGVADANLVLMFRGISFENVKLVSRALLEHKVEIYILNSVFIPFSEIPRIVGNFAPVKSMILSIHV